MSQILRLWLKMKHRLHEGHIPKDKQGKNKTKLNLEMLFIQSVFQVVWSTRGNMMIKCMLWSHKNITVKGILHVIQHILSFPQVTQKWLCLCVCVCVCSEIVSRYKVLAEEWVGFFGGKVISVREKTNFGNGKHLTFPHFKWIRLLYFKWYIFFIAIL